MKKHTITTYQDMLDLVTDENVEQFTNDLKALLKANIEVKKANNGVKMGSYFIWTDDGKNQLIFNIKSNG